MTESVQEEALVILVHAENGGYCAEIAGTDISVQAPTIPAAASSAADLACTLDVEILTRVKVERWNPQTRSWTHLSESDLFGLLQRFAGAQWLDLSGCDLSGLDLSPAALDKQGIRAPMRWPSGGINLSYVNLAEAQLKNSDLRCAYLANANLREVAMFDCQLEEAGLYDANLQRASLVRVNLCKASLTKANLVGAELLECSLDDAILYEANLREADHDPVSRTPRL